MSVQEIDIQRIRAEHPASHALGMERTYIRNQLFEVLRKLSVAEPFQMPKLTFELETICAALREHTENVIEHWRPGK